MLFRRLALGYLFKRLFGRQGGRGGGGRAVSRRGRGRPRRGDRSRGRAGLFGPIPYYSTRTRRGTRVSVGGCCLPLALGIFSLPVLGARVLRRS